MQQSQAAGLLANNQRYLVHMCQKGLKGRDYTKISNWFKMILQSSNKLVSLLEIESTVPRALPMTLNVIKSGLLSEDVAVASLCARCLIKVSQLITERAAY